MLAQFVMQGLARDAQGFGQAVGVAQGFEGAHGLRAEHVGARHARFGGVELGGQQQRLRPQVRVARQVGLVQVAQHTARQAAGQCGVAPAVRVLRQYASQ